MTLIVVQLAMKVYVNEKEKKIFTTHLRCSLRNQFHNSRFHTLLSVGWGTFP
jgi:hypothetical protein